MKSILNKIVRFLICEEGPTAVEYALLLMLVFLACLTAIVFLGQRTTGSFEHSENEIQSAMIK
jgi:pilus assembly protein Flp/PilA